MAPVLTVATTENGPVGPGPVAITSEPALEETMYRVVANEKWAESATRSVTELPEGKPAMVSALGPVDKTTGLDLNQMALASCRCAT